MKNQISIVDEDEKLSKQSDSKRWRIERADDAKITFTIALHDKRAWEVLLEDTDRSHSISHGWAIDLDWEESAPL